MIGILSVCKLYNLLHTIALLALKPLELYETILNLYVIILL